MIRFDQHRAPIEVVQFIAEDGRCSYLLASGQTKVAALVDPDPSMEARYRTELASAGLRLRAVFDTSDRDEAAAPLWEGTPRVGPIGTDRWLAAGAQRLALAEADEEPSAYTIWGSAYPPSADKRYGPIRIAFGPFHVAVLRFDDPRRIAYRVGDRLFSGHQLRANTEDGPVTPDRLLSLDDHVIVYPAWAEGRVSVSIIAAERRALVAGPRPSLVPTQLHPVDEPEPLPLEDESVEPLDYWTALEMGREAARDKRYADARRAFEAALSARPGDRIAQQNLNRVDQLDTAAPMAAR